jgi:energy-coupling factor transporter transmembrane protein EcfT
MSYWFISFIPVAWITFVIHAVFLTGVVGLIVGGFASKIPFVSAYGNIVKAVAGILFIAGLFLEGYNFASQEWIQESERYQEQVRIAEEKSKQVNTQIQTVYRDKVKIVKEQEIVIKEKIKEVEKIIDAKCEVTPESIQILNQAAKTPVKEEKK